MGLGNILRAQVLRKFLPIGSFGMAPAVLKEKKDDSSPESSQGSDEGGEERRMRTVGNCQAQFQLPIAVSFTINILPQLS